MYRYMGFNGVNNIDDIGSAETTDYAESDFRNQITLIDVLGFKIAEHKCCPPNTRMIFLGKYFDTVNMTISFPSEKLVEISGIIHNLLNISASHDNSLKIHWLTAQGL